MTKMTKLKTIIPKLIAKNDPEALEDAFGLCRELEMENAVRVEGAGKRDYGTIVHDKENFSRAHEYNRRIRAAANQLFKDNFYPDTMLELYYKTHLFDAPYYFDSFCIYIEKDRAPEKQFYLPRRKQLLRCADAIQGLEDGKYHTVGISLAPGVGKTTLAEFGLAWCWILSTVVLLPFCCADRFRNNSLRTCNRLRLNSVPTIVVTARRKMRFNPLHMLLVWHKRLVVTRVNNNVLNRSALRRNRVQTTHVHVAAVRSTNIVTVKACKDENRLFRDT